MCGLRILWVCMGIWGLRRFECVGELFLLWIKLSFCTFRMEFFGEMFCFLLERCKTRSWKKKSVGIIPARL